MVPDYLVYRHEHDDWDMLKFHFHDQYEVLLSLSDQAVMFVNNRQYHLQPGSVLLLSPSVLHRSVARRGKVYERLVLRFSESCLRSITGSADILLSLFSCECTHIQLDTHLTKALEELYRDCMTVPSVFGGELRHQLALINLLLFLGEHSCRREIQPPPTQDTESLREILQYISAHLTADLSLDSLSAQFFLSKSQLCRKFREETGFAPGEYIIALRIMKAKSLLQEGSSVQDAMHHSGFRSYSHFIRTFHHIVGQTPGQYRRGKDTAPD